MIKNRNSFAFLSQTIKNSSKLFAVVSALTGAGTVGQAASLNITGNYRFGATMLVNPDLTSGSPVGEGRTTSFLEHRALLRPDIVVDDRFTVKSELSLLQNTLNSPNQVGDGFGTTLDRSSTQLNNEQMLYLRRVYLEWASDWGIFRFGRQPKSWGLGILYNAGNDPFDDYGTTVDRMGFQAMLGNLTLNVGYEKGVEGFAKSDADDIDTYEISMEYNNPESLFDVGILYSRNVRSGHSLFTSSHDLSIFSQKRWNKFQLGGEFVSIRQDSRSSTTGILAQMDLLPGNWDIGLDLAYASGAANASYAFHPNYQPFLLMFHHNLGTTGRLLRGGLNGAGVGSAVGSGDGAGALIVKTGAAYAFDSKLYTLGVEVGYAKLMRTGNNSGDKLGVESDIHFTHKWYDNFSTYYTIGFLFPGSGYTNGANVAWGTQIRGALTF